MESQLVDRRAIIQFLNLLDYLPPEILNMVARRIVANISPDVCAAHEVNRLASFVLQHFSFSRKLASAALHELPAVVTIEYTVRCLEFDLLQYTLPLGRSITWLPFPPNRLQHPALIVPLGGPHAVYLPGMTGSISTLPQAFPGLRSLELMMNWDGAFVIPGHRALTRNQYRDVFRAVVMVFIDFWDLVNALARVDLARKSVYDLARNDGPVSFNGSRKAACARLLEEDLLSRAPRVSRLFMGWLHWYKMGQILESNDDDEFLNLLDRPRPRQ